MATADIANAQAQKLREVLKEIPPGKKDRRQMKDSTNLAGVMTGGAIMRTMEERDQKDQEIAAQKAAKGASRTRKVANGQFAAPQALEGPQTPIRPPTLPRPPRCTLPIC